MTQLEANPNPMQGQHLPGSLMCPGIYHSLTHSRCEININKYLIIQASLQPPQKASLFLLYFQNRTKVPWLAFRPYGISATAGFTSFRPPPPLFTTLKASLASDSLFPPRGICILP